MNLENLYPERVFHHFLEISKIPRGSGNEKAISDYLVDFAKKHNLYVYQDESNNILIRKEASKGYEKYKAIALQGHMDMVCDKNKNVEFDFEKEAIKVKVEDGFIKADGTTLGADNGICVAMVMSILESDEIKHPKLEILLTTDEEVSMSGAENFDITKLESDILVNIDSEQYGSIYVSSAGCSAVASTLELNSEQVTLKDKIYTIEVKGLQGGHSGGDIHENRANANKILAELISKISIMFDTNIVDFNGGAKNNTIPREAMATLVINGEFNEINDLLQLSLDGLNFAFKETEKEMLGVLEKVEYSNQKQLNETNTERLLRYILTHPTSVIRKSTEIENLIQTSLNLGILETREKENTKEFYFNSLVRSSKAKEQRYIVDYVLKYAEKYGAKGEILDFCNPWEYKKDSPIRDYFAKVFEKQNGYKPEILAIHAGLECGIFSEHNPNLDIISIGPDIKNPHTPDERMSIEAVANTWEYLLKILEGYKID
ncbi:aminoacyl-histidine dipeptidase [Oceanivirga salmonicida]|uniref:aminoacyl-histidine dipeptidase n=1 Tax=Oceanivirga salmonicida TaxID=1769291 RepID=UPI00083553EB|nr:aminoacyl-histidine dipeptidase [Oceanivirga salmonicida]